jgi:hypothetical protein
MRSEQCVEWFERCWTGKLHGRRLLGPKYRSLKLLAGAGFARWG